MKSVINGLIRSKIAKFYANAKFSGYYIFITVFLVLTYLIWCGRSFLWGPIPLDYSLLPKNLEQIAKAELSKSSIAKAEEFSLFHFFDNLISPRKSSRHKLDIVFSNCNTVCIGRIDDNQIVGEVIVFSLSSDGYWRATASDDL
jgi:hypothetical protein